MLEWFKKKIGGDKSPDSSAAASNATAAVASQHYLSDDPISAASQDRFRRAPFAARIADTLVARGDRSSLVVGIFSPWGDGKTSVLQMMEEALDKHPDAVVIRFNPWHFASEEQLMRGFFTTLADGLGAKLPNLREQAGEALKKYGSLLSLGSVTVAGMLQIRPGDAIKGLGDAMSDTSLAELKGRIDEILAKSGKRIVVMIDDIDRLDRAETHSIFKLVKLSASFRNTAYVLAFDEEVVSAALGERYGSGGQAAGRAFLEKIIQVPLPASLVSVQCSIKRPAFGGAA